MSVAFVAPGRSLRIDPRRLALWRSLRTGAPRDPGNSGGPLPSVIADLSGWWDVSTITAALGANGTPIGSWNSMVASLSDRSGRGIALTPYSFSTLAGLPVALPRLSALLGGLGRISGGTGTLAPALDPDLGFQVPDVPFHAS